MIVANNFLGFDVNLRMQVKDLGEFGVIDLLTRMVVDQRAGPGREGRPYVSGSNLACLGRPRGAGHLRSGYRAPAAAVQHRKRREMRGRIPKRKNDLNAVSYLINGEVMKRRLYYQCELPALRISHEFLDILIGPDTVSSNLQPVPD